MVDNIDEIIKALQRKVADKNHLEESQQQEKRTPTKTPPYITVGSGLATKQFPADVSIDAFEVFNELSKAQRVLFIEFKNILIQQNFDNWIKKYTVENPNIVFLSVKDHDNIRTELSKNRNGTTLVKKGVLKKIKNNVYMLNPYIFIPASNFGKIAAEWNELPSKRGKTSQPEELKEDQL